MTLPAKVVRRGPADILLAMEAFTLLIFFRICLALLPVRKIIRVLTRGHAQPAPPGSAGGTIRDPAEIAPAIPDRSLRIARRVQWAVSAVARHSPVEFVCFPQTLAGYTMLRWRKVPSTMVYGVARSPEGELIAHTWLNLGDRTVLGGEEAPRFTPIERWS
jgi:hypothetical protein